MKKRVVVHFPGFERMDARAHHGRFTRTVEFSSKLWDFSAEAGAFDPDDTQSGFEVVCRGPDWAVSNRIHILDHNVLVDELSDRPLVKRFAMGFLSAARVVGQGGLFGYFRHAWRFGLFFVFPFLLVALAFAISLALAVLPVWLGLSAWHILWSVSLAGVFFRSVFLPFSERYHTLHLFSDWELAVAVGGLTSPSLSRWLEESAERMMRALDDPADEYLITSHSMGSSLATQVLGMVLEKHPQALAGKRVVFVTLGSAILQCALLRPADVMRRRIGAIARAPDVTFLEVHCLTDVIHFYKSRVVALSGHKDAPQAGLIFIRVRALLSEARYKKIKRDFLRVHRQYVLHADRRGSFDFALLTTGPFAADGQMDYLKSSLEAPSAEFSTGA
ncbi:hypothetical protein [Rhizobium sp. CG5]|uniref:hypothetical protein n=1 Tax=Rhizobium sp. CG5 TaxID=2726076 RepID=UPI003330EAAA